MPDKDQIDRAKKFAAVSQDYKNVFGTKQGERVLYDIMKGAHIIEPSYVKGDPHETSFREGERNMALRIFTHLNMDVDQLKKRIEEGEQE